MNCIQVKRVVKKAEGNIHQELGKPTGSKGD
jgi:hypothetical protein